MEKTDIAYTLDRSPIFNPNKLASYYTKEHIMIGSVIQEVKKIKKAFSIQLNKELAEYLYSCLGRFLGKTI